VENKRLRSSQPRQAAERYVSVADEKKSGYKITIEIGKSESVVTESCAENGKWKLEKFCVEN